MESSPERCVRLLVAAETLVEEECFAATRGDWQDVRAVQDRAEPLLRNLGELFADGSISAPQKERLAPRLEILRRQHAGILTHIETHRRRLAGRMAAVEAASGRLTGMKKAYGPPAGTSAALRESA